jgi:SAM-dependent methyltransferase
MYDKIFKLIQNGELNKAQEQLENTPENDPKRYNISGLIYYQKKEFDKAKEEFEKGLKINPVDSDLLFNYGYLLKNINQEKEAWRYLMRIHNKDWATYDLLGDIEYKNRSKLASLRFYKKAAELPNSPNEMKKKFIEMRNNVKQDTKIAFLCLPGLDNFLKDIVETFSLGYDVKLVVTTNGNQISEAIKWADIVWLEWANEMAVFATNQIPEIQNKKVVCRLHRYEAFTQFPDKINWKNVDFLIFVAESMKKTFHELHPNINLNSCKEEIVYNGVDLDKFKFLVHKPGYNLSVLAHINYRKNPETWVQIIGKLKEIDNRYKLHVGGDFQDPLYKIYFDYIKKEMKLENNFILHGWINEVDKFLEDKDYTLSTSIHEGHPYNILESMARGIKPVILNYSGAKEQWPNELIYNTIDEAVEKITELTYDSESYRRFIEDNYSLEKQIDNMEYMINQFNSFKKKEMKAEKPLTIIDTKKYYDNFLEYLKMDHIRPNPRHNHVKKTLEQLIKPGSKVLDIGCGTGISSYFMASKGAIVTAVDLSNKLIEFAKQNSFHENVTYIVADATKLKLDKRFDIITIIDSMEHIPKDNIMDFFNVIERHSLNQTIIYLNIPDGRYQRFIKNNYPERLQIIDEDYDHLFLIENFKKIGFEISFLNIFGLDLPYQYNEFIFISEEALNNSYKKNILKYIK